jgi:hypothetical protein
MDKPSDCASFVVLAIGGVFTPVLVMAQGFSMALRRNPVFDPPDTQL